MIDACSIGEATPLPPPPTGWFDYGYTALMDGKLALVRTPMDVHAAYRQWWEAINNGDRKLRKPAFWDRDVRLSIYDGSAETSVAIVPSGRYPIVDQTADGRWLVASSRSDNGARNGRIYAPNGVEERTLALGDAIQDLFCAPDGTLWVGYFDEGVFDSPSGSGTRPVSSGGIVQFDAAGEICWSFNDRVPNSRLVADCYAMTLNGNTLWACYYTDFPIVRIDKGKTRYWRNAIAGAHAIAVQDGIAILAGGYDEDAGRVAVLRLEGDTSRPIGSLSFRPPAPGSAGLVQGRGSTLHIVSDGSWTRIPVYCALQALDA